MYTHSDEVDIEPIKSIWLRAIKVLATVGNEGGGCGADGNVSNDSLRWFGG